jgi:signal transduction histidine kinase
MFTAVLAPKRGDHDHMNPTCEAPTYIDCLAGMAKLRFTSLETATARMLHCIAEQLGVQVSFLIQFDHASQMAEVAAIHNTREGHEIATRVRTPFSCNEVAGAESFTNIETQSQTDHASAFALLLSALSFPAFGSHIGVPLKLSDGVILGVLGAFDPDSRQFDQAQIDFLTILAQQLANEIERNQDINQRQHIESKLDAALAALRSAHGDLERMQKLRNEFISVVSHEFHTALAGIQGFSEIVRDEACSPEEVKDFAADIYADAQRLNRIIADILDLDSIESGNMKLAFDVVDLNTLIQNVISRFRPAALNHRIQMRLDPALMPIAGDNNKLQQALTSLLSNAINYLPHGGHICMSSTRDGSFAHVRVEDEATSVPTQVLERIFEHHTPAEAGTYYAFQAFGLGLPLVREIAQMHGGNAWAEGTTGHKIIFHLTVRLADER